MLKYVLVLIATMMCACEYDAHENQLHAIRCDTLPARIVMSVYISGDFTPEEQADIFAGANMWSRAVPDLVTWYRAGHPLKNDDVRIQGQCDTMLVNVAPTGLTSNRVLGYESRNPASRLLGVVEPYFPPYSTPTNVWLVSARLRTSLTPVIVAHELGHVMGMRHNKDPDSVMNGNPTDGPSPTDAEALRAMYR